MKQHLLSACAGLALLGLAGCATGPEVRVTQPGSAQAIKTTGIDIGDCQATAQAMVDSLLASDIWGQVPHQPAIIVMSVVQNNTGQRAFNTRLITQKISTSLNKSGKALTRINYGVGADGKPLTVDPIAKGDAEQNAFTSDRKVMDTPDFSLSGEIIETYARSGRTSEHNYSFHMRMTRNNIAVWEEENEIGKQHIRRAFGL